VIKDHGSGLDLELHDGGAPLSQGQVQLLSLARAIVRDTKILILDEATANVDVDTDALIQETIKEEFSHKTVIAIAHRLHTIIDGDKVMVLDKGTLAEFDSPANLLRNPNGIFSSMVRDTGEASARFLRSVAFGEVNMKDARAEDAAKGLERMTSMVSETSVGWTNEMLSSAQEALKHLSTVREQLVQHQRRNHLDSGEIEDAQSSLLASSILDAMRLVNEIEGVAKEAKTLLKHQGTPFADPALLGTPQMMESLAMSENRHWTFESSSPVPVSRSPARRRSMRRSYTTTEEHQSPI